MRRLITLATLSLSLLGGGAAMAANRNDKVDHDRVELRDHRPEPKFERHDQRRGFRWIGGEWVRAGRGWSWRPGHYVRAR